jgi:hypothetical protein
VAIEERLYFDPVTGRGVAFSLPGCVAEHGKLGLTAIGETHEAAQALYAQAVAALDLAAGCEGEPLPQR